MKIGRNNDSSGEIALVPASPKQSTLNKRVLARKSETAHTLDTRRRSMPLVYAPLTREDMRFIREHPELTVREIAEARHLAGPMVRAERRRYAIVLLHRGFPELSDMEIAGRSGLPSEELRRIRKGIGLYRLRGPRVDSPHKLRKIMPSALGSAAEICYALTEGGQSVTDIVRTRKARVSRQRAHDIIEDMGLVVSKLRRTPRWYATRIGHPELGDKGVARHVMKNARSLNAAAQNLRPPIEPEVLSDILKRHGLRFSHIPFKPKTLRCAFCRVMFTVPGREYRARKRKRGHARKFFCDRSCAIRHRWARHPASFRRKR